MRADRLLALMMILQSKEQPATAEGLAGELEVSTRTIYRDIDALSFAGVPVYATGGPGGGYALLDSYRTTLTGLNNEEMHALFMLTIPGPLTDLGINRQLKTAVLKVTSSLPDRYNEQAEYIHKRLHMDAAGWFQQAEDLPYLDAVQEAVWQDRRIRISYRRAGGSRSERMIDPIGLVAKAGVWYTVASAENGMQVYRVSRIEGVELTSEHFARSEDFDLPQFWDSWAAEYIANLPSYPVRLRISPELAPVLPSILGESVREKVETAWPDPEGWRLIDHRFEREEEALAYIMTMGSSAEVVAPETLRERIRSLAEELLGHYKR